MPANFETNEYDLEIKKQQYQQKGMFVISRIMKVFVYLIKLVLTMVWGVTKGVLKTFGIPIGQ